MSVAMPGDRVRVTVEGRVTERFRVVADDGTELVQDLAWATRHATVVEVLPPPDPPWAAVEGAVVLDASGMCWRKYQESWYPASPVAPKCSTYRLLRERCGPLKLLHEPSI